MEICVGGGGKMSEKLNIQLPEKLFGYETKLIGTLTVPIVLTMIFLGTGMSILMPKIDEIRVGIDKINTLTQERIGLVNKRKYLSSLDVEQMKSNSKLIESSLMAENNSYWLVELMRKLAEKYGFEVDSFSVSPGEAFDNESLSNETGIVKLSTTVSLVGPKEKYLELIKGIENSLPILEINGFEAKENDLMVTLDMGINSFYIGRKEKQILDKLNISELEMTKDEKNVLDKLSSYGYIYEIDQSVNTEVVKKEFVKYNRDNPFSL